MDSLGGLKFRTAPRLRIWGGGREVVAPCMALEGIEGERVVGEVLAGGGILV